MEPPAPLLGGFLWSWPKKVPQTPKGKPLWVRLCAGDWVYLGGSTYRRWYPLDFARLGCGLFRATALCAGALTWVFSWAATRPGGATRGGLRTSWGAFFGLGQRKPPRPRRRHNLRILRFRASPKAQSLRCSSLPPHKHACAAERVQPAYPSNR